MPTRDGYRNDIQVRPLTFVIEKSPSPMTSTCVLDGRFSDRREVECLRETAGDSALRRPGVPQSSGRDLGRQGVRGRGWIERSADPHIGDYPIEPAVGLDGERATADRPSRGARPLSQS